MKRKVLSFIKLTICFSMLIPILMYGGLQKVEASTDPNIIEYAGVELPAYDGYAEYVPNPMEPWRHLSDTTYWGKTWTHRDAVSITNIKYNKYTKMISYDVSQYQTKQDSYRGSDLTSNGPLWIEQYFDWDSYLTTGVRIEGLSASGVMHSRDFTHNFYDIDIYYFGSFPHSYATRTIPARSYSYSVNNGWIQEYDIEEPKFLVFENTWGSYVTKNDSNATTLVKEFYRFPLIVNSPPQVSVISQNNMTLINEPGLSTMDVEGYAQDPDNDDLEVIVEVPNVFYRKIKVTGTKSPKYFSVPIDVISDSIPPGSYQVKVKVVDPYKYRAEAPPLNFTVQNRLKRNAFVLINSPIISPTVYTDSEGDPKYAERYKYEHDPAFFDNSMGLISDSGQWRSATYASFPYTGQYVATVQFKDNPKTNDQFDNYRLWSRDNLSALAFQVHRKPIAIFAAKIVNGTLQLTDSSYDLDHISRNDKGLSVWQWQYKLTEDEFWTEGQPPAQLPKVENYDIRLRVRDIDGENGNGVWSDWCLRTVGKSAANLPPVALFTADPNIVSYKKTTLITDKSFDPNNDYLDIYEWIIRKSGAIIWSYSGTPTLPPSITGYGVGSYEITLRVHDNLGLWSEPYTQNVNVVNHPPIAAFEMPTEVYRDTLITLQNKTRNPDEDGDALTFGWNARIDGGTYRYVGGNENQSLTVRDLLSKYGISQQQAISNGWEMRLEAWDGTYNSFATKSFSVINHVPTAQITGPVSVYQYDSKTYTSTDTDDDSADQSSLRYYWNVTDSNGGIKTYSNPNITVTFDEPGKYTLQHWVVDQIGDKSNIAVLNVTAAENLRPSMTITSPAGTIDSPTVLLSDPLMKWSYSDQENDAQEKYRFEFFTMDSLLAQTIENIDTVGTSRQYQTPNLTFERFVYYTVNGRAASRGQWSEVSNEKAFIIDTPPVPGFTLNQSSGHRNEDFLITGTATDADILKGDSITYKYYLKPFGGSEALISASSDFVKQFTTHGSFTIRQVVTDSLGIFSETSRSITISNQIPTVDITYPGSSNSASPTVASTLTPILQWNYQDGDGDLQQRFKVRVIDLATNNIVAQSGETASSAKQWTITGGTIVENKKYAVEVEVFDGYEWSSISPRKYFMVNLLTIQGGVKHTTEWNDNRIGYNLKKSGNPDNPRGYNVFWAGERFILQADTTGLPDTVEVTMPGGYHTQLSATSGAKTLWTGELYDPSFENLPNGPISFTFTAQNAFSTKVDTVTVTISEEWSEFSRSHRTK
ncbi:hypothetical protein [Paenibacillus wynnii]|uniref:PKD domain-containing protein n=1 Tax=Paenibacillus wynnii TaxID=268407 RepID=A0A098MAD6_9BACL|nr:hypothetical protein [Paenibacillus wynnii]KGE19021.1 hypothetical protein PWYN_06400 [Paenibacillus wynnii]